MRLSKVLELDEKRSLIVRELRVADIHNAIGMAEDFKGLELAAFTDPAKLAGLLAVLGDCVELKGCNIESLAFSEIQSAFDTFREVNAAFFGLLAKAGVNLGMAANGAGSLSGPAAPSSSAATDGSASTAGASS